MFPLAKQKSHDVWFSSCLVNIACSQFFSVKNGPTTKKTTEDLFPPRFVLLELLLGADVAGVAARLLAAVGRARREARVALAAHLLLPVVLLGERDERGLHDAAAELELESEVGRHLFLFFCHVTCTRTQRTIPPKEKTLQHKKNVVRTRD